jgi:hypothetical protein
VLILRTAYLDRLGDLYWKHHCFLCSNQQIWVDLFCIVTRRLRVRPYRSYNTQLWIWAGGAVHPSRCCYFSRVQAKELPMETSPIYSERHGDVWGWEGDPSDEEPNAQESHLRRNPWRSWRFLVLMSNNRALLTPTLSHTINGSTPYYLSKPAFVKGPCIF